MLTVTAVEGINTYIFTVSFYTLQFIYEFGKFAPDGQNQADYLQVCKNESTLLAQHEIDSWAQPVPIAI